MHPHSSVHTPLTVSLPKSQITCFLEKKGYSVSVFAQWWQLLKTKIWKQNTLLVGGFNPSEKYNSNWFISPGRGEIKNIRKYLKPPRPPRLHQFHFAGTPIERSIAVLEFKGAFLLAKGQSCVRREVISPVLVVSKNPTSCLRRLEGVDQHETPSCSSLKGLI